jgi:hypothetical protein
MASSIMCFFPLNTLGLQLFLALWLALLFSIFEDDPDLYAFGLTCLLWVVAVVVGVVGLKCLNNEDVIAGYEYVAE